MGMRTAKVEVGDIKPQVLAVGAIAWNERDQVNIQARALGYVEKLHVDAKLDTVTAGQPLLDLYVPDWVAVQEEFLAVQHMEAVGVDELLEASRSRMRQSGMADEHIRLVEKTARVQARLTLRSPLDGVVTELFAREGMTVTPSQTLVRIQGINPVWVEAEIPETQAALLTQGNKVEAKTPAFPGRVFTGEVAALLPQVNPDTRTITARMVLANPSGQLVPGMFAEMRVAGKRNTEMLLVPSEAVIRTGNRDLVMVAEDEGLFRPVEVITGIEDGSRTEIRQGLRAGQSIVVSGQFLVDSEASLKGIEARLGEAALAAESYHAQARIEAINAERLTLSHSPVPALKWPSMTMDFRLSPDLEPQDLSVGQKIDVEFILEKDRPPLIIGFGNLDRDSAGDAP
jgi:Cu(I)/Ag(I) efflux system membrane fusion protein